MVAHGIAESILTKYLFTPLPPRDKQNFYRFEANHEYSTVPSKLHQSVSPYQ